MNIKSTKDTDDYVYVKKYPNTQVSFNSSYHK